jgi:hypothetical protein
MYSRGSKDPEWLRRGRYHFLLVLTVLQPLDNLLVNTMNGRGQMLVGRLGVALAMDGTIGEMDWGSGLITSTTAAP